MRRGSGLAARLGIRSGEAKFTRGNAALIRDPRGAEIGRGLVDYDAKDARRILGRSTEDVLAMLGVGARADVTHRDDLALSG